MKNPNYEYTKPPAGIFPDPEWIYETQCKGLWLFNEGGGTLVNDLSGCKNHGTLTNMAIPPTATSGWTGGKFGSALAYDYSDDYVKTSNAINPVSEFSISAWINVINLTANMSIAGGRVTASNGWYFAFRGDLAGDPLMLSFQGVTDSSSSASGIVINQWYFVVATWKNPTSSFYINGVPKGTASSLTSYNPTIYAPYVGQINASGSPVASRYFGGIIDHVAIYSRVLTLPEIQRLYAEPFYMFPKRSPVLYFIPAGGTTYDETAKSQVILAIQSLSDNQAYSEIGKLQTILSAQEMIDAQTDIETNKSQIILVTQGESDGLTNLETNKLQTLLIAQISSDYQIDYEVDKSAIVLVAQGMTDTDSYYEIGKSQINLIPQSMSDLHSMYEQSKVQTILVYQDKTEVFTGITVYDETGKLQQILVVSNQTDISQFYEVGKSQVNIIVEQFSDSMIVWEGGKSQEIKVAGSGQEYSIANEQDKLALIKAVLNTSDILSAYEMAKTEIVIVVLSEYDNIVVPVMEGKPIIFGAYKPTIRITVKKPNITFTIN